MPLPRSFCFTPSAIFTPAAASHVGGDSNGGVMEFVGAGQAGEPTLIQGVSLLVAGATIETTAWILHLFAAALATPILDDAAFDVVAADRANYLGSIAIPQVVDLGTTLWIESWGLGKVIKPTTSSLFGHLVNVTTLTPQAVAHTVTLYMKSF